MNANFYHGLHGWTRIQSADLSETEFEQKVAKEAKRRWLVPSCVIFAIFCKMVRGTGFRIRDRPRDP
jgi:hypothetical protein